MRALNFYHRRSALQASSTVLMQLNEPSASAAVEAANASPATAVA
jgi:hypothetical protein